MAAAVWSSMLSGSRDQPFLGIAAHETGISNPIANLEICDTGSHGRDLTSALGAEHCRQADFVKTGAVIGVDVVQAHCTVLQAHLALARLSDVDFLPLHDFRAAMLVNSDCVDHDLDSS